MQIKKKKKKKERTFVRIMRLVGGEAERGGLGLHLKLLVAIGMHRDHVDQSRSNQTVENRHCKKLRSRGLK